MHPWKESPQRHQVCVILSLPAVYAALTGLQQILPGQKLYLGVCAEIYEGLGLLTFLLLLRSVAAPCGTGSPKNEEIQTRSAQAFASLPYECMAATLPAYKTGLLLLATLDSTMGLGCGSLLSRCDLFCSFLLGSVALLAIGKLLAAITKELGHGQAALVLKSKFWAVKGMVTVMFNQSLLLWGAAVPLQKTLALLEMNAREDFEATLVTLEMLLLSLWHTVAFPLDDDYGRKCRARVVPVDNGYSSRFDAGNSNEMESESAWIWPWTVAQMTILAACLFVKGVDVIYHVWFVLACAMCILVAFGCPCLRPMRRLVVVAAVVHLFIIYLLALGRHQGISQCTEDVLPLSANGLAQSAYNCSTQLQRGSCSELWLQGFCCRSCNLTACPHCASDADSLGAAHQRLVLIGVCMSITAALMAILVRAGYSVLGCAGAGHSPSAGRGMVATEYLEFESDTELLTHMKT